MGLRIEYRAPSVQFYLDDLLSRNSQQTGSGVVGGLPVFASSHGILEDQLGEGFFSDWLLPGLKAIGKQLFSTGAQIISDKIRNPGTKTSTIAKRRLVEGGQSLLDKGYKKGTSFLQEQFGSGCSLSKRPRITRSKRKKSAKRRRKNRKPKGSKKTVRKQRKRVYKRKKKTNKTGVKKGRVTKKKKPRRKYRKRGSVVSNVKRKRKNTNKRGVVRGFTGRGTEDLDSLFY